MSALEIYNTLTRRKAALEPIEPGKLRMYVCGMTVYDYCHTWGMPASWSHST